MQHNVQCEAKKG